MKALLNWFRRRAELEHVGEIYKIQKKIFEDEMRGAKEMKIDPKRIGQWGESGIFVRAQDPDGKWGSFDLVELDKESLLQFLNLKPSMAINVVGILLGHGHLK